jgi:hypothetical protein
MMMMMMSFIGVHELIKEFNDIWFGVWLNIRERKK